MQEEKRNLITGILGTVAFHLLALVIVLSVKIGKVKSEHKEKLVIEFAEETYKPIEQIIEEAKVPDEPLPNLPDQTVRNIAVNTANKLQEEISTEEYEQEVMKELGMEELYKDLNKPIEEADLAMEEPKKPEENKKKQNYQGPTRVKYNLENRKHRYIHIPVYICQGSGEVIVQIVVDQSGYVINASVKKSSTSEICINETALESAQQCRFNSDLNAPSRQKGTITYTFVAQ